MNLLIYHGKDELLEDLATFILKVGNEAIAENGRFNFVLTGGSSPKTLYQQLATKYKDDLDWQQVYFFFGDERNVSATDKDYNGLMAAESLLRPLNIQEDHIFYVNTSLSPVEAASAYQNEINMHFNGGLPAFDFILLGMGDDAHTASLFPETEILESSEVGVEAVFVEKLNTYRISMTAGLINHAKNIAFLVFGKSKADAVKQVIESEEEDTTHYPAQLIKPYNGHVTWFLDQEAAANLNT
ncbi:6-phosphogluconolactonase [Pedobacter quisquiliarum]|uniref:6-phosphogluconolactonase n=1 Tax=Pedobacter quisquiliarum TaxID=1834438 RepID=A0A916XB95_9SPHI|nr:6-phosphogluconolactonase [Pedobacter quisquiliarum]GGC59101.1 6-phosphogluconolactonase [Pedobacter quisquiliarum]